MDGDELRNKMNVNLSVCACLIIGLYDLMKIFTPLAYSKLIVMVWQSVDMLF